MLNKYKNEKKLKADFIGRGGAWLDTGSIKDFYNTSTFVSTIENRQGMKIACIEEIAFYNKWIKRIQFIHMQYIYLKSRYIVISSCHYEN